MNACNNHLAVTVVLVLNQHPIPGWVVAGRWRDMKESVHVSTFTRLRNISYLAGLMGITWDCVIKNMRLWYGGNGS